MTSKDLAEQIRNNTRVILPNFGAFLQKSDPNGTFNPNNITFSPFLRYNDGILEHQIASLKSIGIDNAAKEITELTDTIARSIASTGMYKIEGLGFLVQDPNRSIQFRTEIDTITPEPNRKATEPQTNIPTIDNRQQAAPTSYTTVNTERSTKNRTLNQPKQSSEKALDSKPAQVVVDPNNGPLNKKQNASPQHTNIPKKSKPDGNCTAQDDDVKIANIPLKKKLAIIVLFVAVSMAIIIGIAFFIRGLVFPKIKVDKPEQIVVELDKNKPVNSNPPTAQAAGTADSVDMTFNAIKTDDRPQKMDKTEPAENLIEKTLVNSAKQKASVAMQTNANFYLIVGSFKEDFNAQKLHDDLAQKGIKAIVIKRPNGTFAVSADTYTTREDADAAKLKYQSMFPAAWVMSAPK